MFAWPQAANAMHLPNTVLHARGSPTVMVGVRSKQHRRASAHEDGRRDRGGVEPLWISWGLKGFSSSLVWQPPGLCLCSIFHVHSCRGVKKSGPVPLDLSDGRTRLWGMKSWTEQDSCCVRVEQQVSDEWATCERRSSRNEELIFLLRSALLLLHQHQHQGKDCAGYRLLVKPK